MEIWDAYDREGRPVNRLLVRGEAVPEGLYHLVSEILVRHEDGDYLLMQRDPRKAGYGGWFEATAGGSALTGEDALACARRELREETGICADALHPIGRHVSRDTIYHQFLCVTGCAKNAIVLQEGETVAYRWLSEAAFIDFIHSGSMIGHQLDRYRDYFSRMGYL